MSLKIRLARGGAKKRPFYSASSSPMRAARATAASSRSSAPTTRCCDATHAERVTLKERAHPPLARRRRAADRAGRALPRRRRARRRSRASRETPKQSAPKAKAQERAKKAAAAAAGGARLSRRSRRLRGRRCATRRQARLRRRRHRRAWRARRWCASRASPPIPTAVARYGPLEDESGRTAVSACACSGAAKGVLLARHRRASPTATRPRRCAGLRLYLPRAALPAPGDEEYYHADLIGLAAVLADGTPARAGARRP